jgi:hypothetical protein
MKQYMVKRFTPDLCCFYEYAKILDDLGLPGKISDLYRADIVLKFFIACTQECFITVEIGVGHGVNLGEFNTTGICIYNNSPYICISNEDIREPICHMPVFCVQCAGAEDREAGTGELEESIAFAQPRLPADDSA